MILVSRLGGRFFSTSFLSRRNMNGCSKLAAFESKTLSTYTAHTHSQKCMKKIDSPRRKPSQMQHRTCLSHQTVQGTGSSTRPITRACCFAQVSCNTIRSDKTKFNSNGHFTLLGAMLLGNAGCVLPALLCYSRFLSNVPHRVQRIATKYVRTNTSLTKRRVSLRTSTVNR